MVNKERLDILLQEVIQEARALKIPVSSTIEKNVIVNGRPKKRFGCCRKSRNGFEIEVSRFLLDEARCSEKIVKGVLAHEVLHTCRDCYEHGMLWKSYAGQMNKAYGYQIERVNSFAEMGMAGREEKLAESRHIRYIIQCKKCGRQYPRQRFTCVMQKIDAYRCQCGGKLEVFRISDS